MFTAAQYTLLKTEIQTDPKALGYAPLVTAGSDQSIADKLNATYAGVGTVWRPSIRAAELLAQLVWAEVSVLSALAWSQLNAMLVPGTVDATQATIRSFFVGLFPTATCPATNANLTAAAKVVSPTRAEELFGAGTAISGYDVAHALRGV